MSGLYICRIRDCFGLSSWGKIHDWRNTSKLRGHGREIQGCTLTLASVDPQCGSEEVNSMPDLSWEVVREEISWNLENTHFKNCFKVSKYSVCTVRSSLAGLKAIHF